MATTLQKRSAAVAGTIFAAVALLVLAAGVAQARPSLPRLIQHHSALVTTASSGGGAASTTATAGGSSAAAAAPLAAGRAATGGRTATFQRGRFVPATTTGSTGIYIGLGAVLLALAAVAIGLLVSERRSRSVAPASASGATVSSMSSAKPAASAGREGSEETRREAA
jgi:hypothetical protein